VHLFLNPDVSFQPFVLPALIQDFEDDGLLVALNPRVLYPDGHIQRLAKKIPTPVDLIVRRFIPYGGLRSKFARNYELNELDEWREKIEVPIVSGCFLLVRSKKFKEIGGFDERYFMYMEDFDLVRRLAETGRVLLDARFNIVHGYAKGSYRNPVLLRYHIISAIHYFNKWGWFFDKKRVAGNTRFSSMMKTIRSARV
jgi:GT2 family glycosyltransferase